VKNWRDEKLSDWWERRKRRRSPWFDFFEDFDRMEEMMDEMMRRAFETPMVKGEKVLGPYVYGFSISTGPDGKPVIREFGNVQPGRLGPERREEREPLVDIIREKEEVRVVAELPGVEKSDIKLHAAENTLTVSVDTPQRKYFKELELPDNVDPRSAKATYKNGVLEVKLKKTKALKLRGEIVPVE